MNIGVHISLQGPVFNSFRNIPRRGIVGSFMFNFLRSRTAVHSVNLSIKGAVLLQCLGTGYRQTKTMAGRSLRGPPYGLQDGNLQAGSFLGIALEGRGARGREGHGIWRREGLNRDAGAKKPRPIPWDSEAGMAL